MKKNIHPKWFENARITCACGHSFTVGAAKEDIRVEICSKCHPFFTGEMKFVDTMGRVERFHKKQKNAKDYSAKKTVKTKKKKEQEKSLKSQKSLKDMLSTLR